MVGPLSGTITGQMAAFREAVSAISNAIAIDASFTSLMSVVLFWLRLPRALRRTRGAIYITTSRSAKGFWLRDFPVLLGAAVSSRAIVNHLHGNDFLGFRSSARWPTRIALDCLYRSISIACVPASNLVEQYAGYPKTQVRVVPNFFDSNLLTLSLPKPESGTLELLYFSNFIVSKGFPVACEAARILRERGVSVHLTLCGEVAETSRAKATEATKFLSAVAKEDWITVSPAVSGRKKVEVLSRAHVMLLPTRYPTEASPISLIEGLAAGCYVVSTDQGSIPELLAGFDAAIVAPEPTAIADAVQKWAARSDRARISVQNRALALRRYSPDAYRQKIRETLHANIPRP